MAAALDAAATVLALVGLLDSLYFILVTYGHMRPDPRWLPRVCRMDEATCASVVHTREARLLGLPNAVYGSAWYAAVLVGAGLDLTTGWWPLCYGYLVAAAATLLLGAYLVWALLARLRVRCVLCFVAHGINLGLAILLVARCI